MANNKTHWRKILDGVYLAGYDLDDGQGGFKEIQATIDYARRETAKDQQGKDEEVLVLHFKDGVKPMILNVTNSKTIEKLTGSSYLEDWSGKTIIIGTESVYAFGKQHDALRIRPRKVQSRPKVAEKCSICGELVIDQDGVLAEQIVTSSKQYFEKVLCLTHYRAEAAKVKESEDAN